MDLLSLGQQLALPAAKEAKGTINQTGKSFNQSAKNQGVVSRGTTEEIDMSSLQFNPAKVQEREKHDVMQEFLSRLRSQVNHLTDGILTKTIIPFNVILGVSGAPLSKQPALTAMMAKLTGAVTGIIAELSSVRAMNKDLMTTGWKLQRMSEALAQSVKAYFVKAESVIQLEAPLVSMSGAVVSQVGHLVNTTADLNAVTCREEFHRIANVYGLETDFLTALVKTAVLMKSAGDIELGANGEIVLTSVSDMKFKSGGKMSFESVGGTEIKSVTGVDIKAGTSLNLTSGVSIQAQTSALTLHGVAAASLLSSGAATVSGAVGALPFPMAPVPPLDPTYAAPPIVIPPIPVVPPDLIKAEKQIRGSEPVRQAQGMGSVGGPII